MVMTGCSGSGKSTIAIGYLLNENFSCRFLFDPSGEYAERLQRRAATNPAELLASIATGYVIFNPCVMFPGADIAGTEASQKAFTSFCEWAWIQSRKIPGQKILLADEIWQFCTPNQIPISLRAIVQNGRKAGLGLLATTQKPNKMNETIIGEATEFIGFRLEGRLLLKSLEDNFDGTFPVRDLPDLVLVDKVRSQCIAQNRRSKCIRRYELDFVSGKLRRL